MTANISQKEKWWSTGSSQIMKSKIRGRLWHISPPSTPWEKCTQKTAPQKPDLWVRKYHPHRPSYECRPCLHKLKQRRCNWNSRRWGNDGVSQICQGTGRITVGRKGVRSKHLHSSKWPNNHRSSLLVSSATNTNWHGTRTDYGHDEGSNAVWMSTTGKIH